MRVTVQFFHPFPRRSQTNRPLWEAARSSLGVECRDLYEIYPEFSIDVAREQEVLERSDILLFQHPFYWYNCPSLMKEWIDSVLELGWAYGPGGDKLRGKYWLQAITTGGGAQAYARAGNNRFSVAELLRPFEQSAKLCGMIPLRPFVTHGAPGLSDQDRANQVAAYRELLAGLVRGELPPPLHSEPGAEFRHL